MATWNKDNIHITEMGRLILSKLQNGEGSAEITKVVTGSGRVDNSQLSTLANVVSEQQNCEITGKESKSDGSIINLRLSNKNLSQPYILNQVGVYIRHSDIGEVLYMIAQCDSGTGDMIPLPSVTPLAMNLGFYILHSENANLTINISDTGVASIAQIEDLERKLKEKADKTHTHNSLEVYDNDEILIANNFNNPAGNIYINYRGANSPIKNYILGAGISEDSNNNLANLKVKELLEGNTKLIDKYASKDGSIFQPKIISNGTNLNDLGVNYGYYVCLQNPIARSLKNCPTQYSFGMFVSLVGDRTIKQTIITYFDGGDKIYTRSNYNGWSSWKEVSFSDHTHNSLDIFENNQVIIGKGFSQTHGDLLINHQGALKPILKYHLRNGMGSTYSDLKIKNLEADNTYTKSETDNKFAILNRENLFTQNQILSIADLKIGLRPTGFSASSIKWFKNGDNSKNLAGITVSSNNGIASNMRLFIGERNFNNPSIEIKDNGNTSNVIGELRENNKRVALKEDITRVNEYVEQETSAPILLSKLKRVDGIGSGLDADLLDGKNSSDFMSSNKGDGTLANDLGVAKELRWKHYGQGHTIFDASNGTTPTGRACDRHNSENNYYTANCPNLMGWNGHQTYGLGVDRARTAEQVQGFQFRNNNGQLEVLVNGEWLPVGGRNYFVTRPFQYEVQNRTTSTVFSYSGGAGAIRTLGCIVRGVSSGSFGAGEHFSLNIDGVGINRDYTGTMFRVDENTTKDTITLIFQGTIEFKNSITISFGRWNEHECKVYGIIQTEK